MSKTVDTFVSAFKDQSKPDAVLDKLGAIAHSSAVFGAPVTAGEYTVITAAEVGAGMGYGFGIGLGSGSGPQGSPAGAEQPAPTGQGSGEGGGGGGGAGGGARSRPVAVIQIGPEGVLMQPVVDVTALGLAMFTALGAMFVMFARMSRGK
jgi:uncharacterized spore protein YtfJ